MLVLGAHLVWDQRFGEGWTDDDLWGLGERAARDLLFGTVRAEAERYRCRIAAWIVANEVLDEFGPRTDVPWQATIGPSDVPEAFHLVHEADPEATLLLNDFGYETDDEFTSAAGKREATLAYLDELLGQGVPVHALGIQAHLQASRFLDAFHAGSYRAFLSDVAGPGATRPRHRRRVPRVRRRRARRAGRGGPGHVRAVRPVHLAPGGLPARGRRGPPPVAVRRAAPAQAGLPRAAGALAEAPARGAWRVPPRC
jgi:hypothetical protein